MKVSTRINEYRHEVIDCPFCDGWVYLRPSTAVSPDPLRDLKRHIVTQAKNETFAWMLGAAENVGKHFLYYKEHSAIRPQRNGTLKRQFDSDLSL